MSNNDYELEDMESSAMKKSEKLKKGVLVGAAVLGAGGTVAYGAEQLVNSGTAATDNLDTDAMMAGAQAGSIDESVLTPEEAPAAGETASVTTTQHVYHHVVDDTAQAQPEPDVDFNTTTVIYDENGNVVSSYDQGQIDGKDFVLFDADGDGIADQMAYDANNNGVFERHEIQDVSDMNIHTGNASNTISVVVPDQHNDDLYYNPNQSQDTLGGIRNDFLDEKTGEAYRGDLAENNPDYRNEENPEHYSAGYGDNADYPGENLAYNDIHNDSDDKFDGNDMAYNETDEDLSFDTSDSSSDYAYDDSSSDYGYHEDSVSDDIVNDADVMDYDA